MSLPELTLLPDGLPAIPRRHRSVGPEPLALPLELLRRQELPQPVGQRVAFANAIVPDRPHVEPPQLEDKEHLGGPPSDASHDREAGGGGPRGGAGEGGEGEGFLHPPPPGIPPLEDPSAPEAPRPK